MCASLINARTSAGCEPPESASNPDLPRSSQGIFAYKWKLLLLLWFAFFLNQADRQVYSIVLPQLAPELHMTAVQAGAVASLFNFALAICVPLAGWAGDRFDRKKIIVLSLAAWSVCTLLSGMATGMGMLIAVRSFASAAGEALPPSAYALIGQYHERTRSRAMSIYQTAVYAGLVSSGVIAGWIADRFGWRYSFGVFGFAGIALAGILQSKLHPAPARSNDHRLRIRAALPQLVRIRSAWWLSAAFGCLVFVNVGFLTWMPTYLHARFQFSLKEAGFTSMFWHYLAALAGVMLGGWLSDRFARSHPSVRVKLQALGLLCGAPFLYWLGITSHLHETIVALLGFGLFRGVYESNTFPSLFEVVPQKYHSTASGMMIACAFLFGALAPMILGVVEETAGLSSAFPLLCGVFIAGSICLLISSHFYFDSDRSRAQIEDLNWRMLL